MKRIYLLAGLAAVLVLTVLVVLRDDDDSPQTEVPEGATELEVGDPITPDASAADRSRPVNADPDARASSDAGGIPEDEAAPEDNSRETFTQEELEDIDVEAQERARLERVEEFHAQHGGPISCETVCDCPAGLDCQIPPGICAPSGRNVYCCTDERCPEGDQCTTPNGRIGTCGEN